MKMTQQQVDDWNETFPVGSPCSYQKTRFDPWIDSRTRSQAWLLGHGEPVVKVEGAAGGYCLDFVRMSETHAAKETT